MNYFVKRGYNKSKMEKVIKEVSKLNRGELLNNNNNKQSSDRVVFTTT